MWDITRESQLGKRKLRSPNIKAAYLIIKTGIDPRYKGQGRHAFIRFITTKNYNLTIGKAYKISSVLLEKTFNN